MTTAALDARMTDLRGADQRAHQTPARLAHPAIFLNVLRATLQAAVRKHILPINPASGIEVKGGSGVSKASAALPAGRKRGSRPRVA